MSSPHNPRRVQLLICLDGLSRMEWSSGSEGPDVGLGAFGTPSGSWGAGREVCQDAVCSPNPQGPGLPASWAPCAFAQPQRFHVPMSRAERGHRERQTRGVDTPPLVRPHFLPSVRAFVHSVVHALPRCSAHRGLSPGPGVPGLSVTHPAINAAVFRVTWRGAFRTARLHTREQTQETGR